jgi:hypothetical protein
MKSGQNARLTVALAFGSLFIAAAAASDFVTIRGTLVAPSGQAPGPDDPLIVSIAGGKKVTLTGDIFSQGQLRDQRLAGRTWEFEGVYLPTGELEIQRLFTVKAGKRYKVTYWCEVCAIRTHEPGRCMCCQDETELQEIPE